MGKKYIPLGKDNFKKLIEEECYYVDKTLLIEELINNKSEVVLFTRPRRFGKSLMISLLKCFFEIPECRKIEETMGIEEAVDYSYLFKDFKIYKDKKSMNHIGKYPVAYFSFKKVKSDQFSDAEKWFKEEISREFERHSYLIDSLNDNQKKSFLKILNREGEISDYSSSIKDLCKYLYLHFKKPVYVLIDEYDTPLHYAKLNGYYQEMLNIIRTMMIDGMKDNSAMKQAIITGIMKIAGESIFSSFNNPKITTISEMFCDDKFGFLEEEVKEILKYYGYLDKFDQVKRWYNGYKFGEKDVYNQWSILNFIDSKAMLKPYWINTGDTELIKRSLQLDITQSKKNIETLLNGGKVKVEIDQNIVYEDVLNDINKSYSFLYHAGYLKASMIENSYYNIEIPNYEVSNVFKGMLKNWLNIEVFRQSTLIHNLIESMLNEKEDQFNLYLKDVMYSNVSYFDTIDYNKKQKLSNESLEETKYENFYHGIILGIMLNLEEYVVESNKEYGLGKPYIVVIPKESKNKGFIFEFKRCKRKEKISLIKLANNAIKQIEDNKYEEGLKNRSDKWVKIGIGYKGKTCIAIFK